MIEFTLPSLGSDMEEGKLLLEDPLQDGGLLAVAHLLRVGAQGAVGARVTDQDASQEDFHAYFLDHLTELDLRKLAATF